MCCLVVLSISVPAFAANIAWVSFHSDPSDGPSAAATSFGFTAAPDKGYTDLLRSAGHTVTRYLTTEDDPNVSSLASYDLVILSRSVNSGHYEEDAETAAWNGLTVPLISMGGYPLRNNRMGFYSGTTIPDTAAPIKLTVNDPSNPIFAGITLDGSNTMVNDYAGIATLPHAPNTVQRGISVVTNPVVAGGTVLATAPVGDPATAAPIIAFFPTGTSLATSPVDTLGGPRLVFLSGSREASNQMFPGQPSNTSSETAGIYDLSADGAQMFLNAVELMAAIPEPSTAMLLVFAVAGLGMLRKR
ncbi:MAG TPA: PEP-CTERM sorting domain-containing protein [Lacipirellulaceae bacterium]